MAAVRGSCVVHIGGAAAGFIMGRRAGGRELAKLLHAETGFSASPTKSEDGKIHNHKTRVLQGSTLCL